MRAILRWGTPVLALFPLFSGCGDSDVQPSCEPVVQDAGDLCSLTRPVVDGHLERSGTIFVDRLDRHILLRGVNAGGRSKMPPFFPFPFAESGFENQEDAGTFEEEMALYVDRLVEWGHNVVRLPFPWEAVEPVRGEYDDVYVGRLVRYIEYLDSREIRVILDFHQDVFSRHFCGDGFPLWAVSEPVPEIPHIDECKSWFMQYLTGGRMADEYARFWRNEDDLHVAFFAMWRHLIEQTRHIEGVIGYEMLNEPYEGGIPTDEWVSDYYIPMVESFADLVDELAPEKTAFFGSPGTDTLSGNTHVTLPERDNVAFGPHFYDPAVYVLGTRPGKWNPSKILNTFFGVSEAWNIPSFIGESGCRTQQEKCDLYLRDVYDALDALPYNVTTWEYSSTVDDWNNEGFGLVDFGGVERPAANEVVRTYPHATAGTFGSFTFDRVSGEANFTYEATAEGITELRVPKRIYSVAPVVTILEGDACAHWDEAAQMVLIQAAQAGRVKVRIQSANTSCE